MRAQWPVLAVATILGLSLWGILLAGLAAAWRMAACSGAS